MEELTECIDITLQHRVEAGNVFLICKVQTKHTADLLCFKSNTSFISCGL